VLCCSGITASLLGASKVVLTDFVPFVLQNLRKTVHSNSSQRRLRHLSSAERQVRTAISESTCSPCGGGNISGQLPTNSGKSDPKTGPCSDEDKLVNSAKKEGAGSSESMHVVLDCSDTEALNHDCFSDAETIADEAELLQLQGTFDTGCNASIKQDDRSPVDCTGEQAALWEVDNMQIRMLNWEKELALLGAVPCVAVAKDANEDVSPPMTNKSEQMFDQPAECSDVPPELPEDVLFPIVLGCEVLYELPHAWLVAAALKRRLAPTGQALVIGAVRDQKVWTL
jgi:hypothetical protein